MFSRAYLHKQGNGISSLDYVPQTTMWEYDCYIHAAGRGTGSLSCAQLLHVQTGLMQKVPSVADRSQLLAMPQQQAQIDC